MNIYGATNFSTSTERTLGYFPPFAETASCVASAIHSVPLPHSCEEEKIRLVKEEKTRCIKVNVVLYAQGAQFSLMLNGNVNLETKRKLISGLCCGGKWK